MGQNRRLYADLMYIADPYRTNNLQTYRGPRYDSLQSATRLAKLNSEEFDMQTVGL